MNNNDDLGTCEVCGVEAAVVVMVRAFATDDDRSNGPAERMKNMCHDCSVEAFESGEWESDIN